MVLYFCYFLDTVTFKHGCLDHISHYFCVQTYSYDLLDEMFNKSFLHILFEVISTRFLNYSHVLVFVQSDILITILF